MNEKANRKTTSKIEEARNSLIQGAMKEIYESLDSPNFYLRVFYVIAKFGLQQEAKKERLIMFEEETTFKIEDKKENLQKINNFLMKYIK